MPLKLLSSHVKVDMATESLICSATLSVRSMVLAASEQKQEQY